MNQNDNSAKEIMVSFGYIFLIATALENVSLLLSRLVGHELNNLQLTRELKFCVFIQA